MIQLRRVERRLLVSAELRRRLWVEREVKEENKGRTGRSSPPSFSLSSPLPRQHLLTLRPSPRQPHLNYNQLSTPSQLPPTFSFPIPSPFPLRPSPLPSAFLLCLPSTNPFAPILLPPTAPLLRSHLGLRRSSGPSLQPTRHHHLGSVQDSVLPRRDDGRRQVCEEQVQVERVLGF